MTKKSILKECETAPGEVMSILKQSAFEKAKVLFGSEDAVTVIDRGIDVRDGSRFYKSVSPSYLYHLSRMESYSDKIRYIKKFI